MTGTERITVHNLLVAEKRAISVYHHATRGAHLISHDGSIALPLDSVDTGDYLYISITRGPGALGRDCRLEIPGWLDFEFSHDGRVLFFHSGNRVSITITAGPPVWQLKLTRSVDWPPGVSATKKDNQVTIGEMGPSGG